MSTDATGIVAIEPRDGARPRLFVTPAGQWLTLKAARSPAICSAQRREILLTLDPADRFTPVAQITIAAPTPGGVSMLALVGTLERGATRSARQLPMSD